MSLLVFVPSLSFGRTLRIAVVDTGFNKEETKNAKFCSNESKDFTHTGLKDTYGHGSAIVSIIADRLKDLDYCIIMVKWFDSQHNNKQEYYINSLKYLYQIKPDIINFSLAGEQYDDQEVTEINKLINIKVILVAAAGNSNRNLDEKCNAYPACLSKKIIVVGGINKDKSKNYVSNYGKVIKMWELSDVIVNGELRHGTSMSTAIATARLSKQLILKGKK